MHSLSPYTIRVHDPLLGGPIDERYHYIGKVRGKDLLQIFKEFTETKDGEYHEVTDDKTKKTIKFTEVRLVGRTIHGWIEYGEFGIKGKVVNVVSGKKVYDKTKHDSDIYQLYFSLRAPVDSKTAVLLLHTVHGKGVKGIVDELFNEYFSQKVGGLKTRIKPLAYEKVMKEWMKNSLVKELRLTKYKSKLDNSDGVDALGDNTVEVTYKAKRGGAFGKFWDFSVIGNHTGNSRTLVDVLSEQCNSVKAVVEFDGRKRIFSLSANQTPVGSIDFDESDVEMDDGAPKLDSLHAFAESWMTDIQKTLKGKLA